MCVLAVVLLVGMSLSASAHHDDKGTKKHKDEKKEKYIGLGIGDHIIICPLGGEVTVDPIDTVEVTITDPLTGNPVPPSPIVIDPPGTTPAVGPITIPGENICLGGAFSTESGPVPPAAFDQWQVWAQDLVFQTIKSVEPTIDIVPAMFARYTAGYSDSGPTTRVCVPPGTATQTCVDQTPVENWFKVLAQFSACGKAGVTGITDPWPSLGPLKWGGDGTYSLTKAVFVDGPIFYGFDCGTGGATVKPVYDDFVHWYNNDPSNPATGPFSGLPSNAASTCNPTDPVPAIFCLFEFPVGGAKCWTEGWSAHHEAAPGIIGTIGWNHVDVATNLDCLEPLGDGPWTKSNSIVTNVVIDNFPVSIGTTP